MQSHKQLTESIIFSDLTSRNFTNHRSVIQISSAPLQKMTEPVCVLIYQKKKVCPRNALIRLGTSQLRIIQSLSTGISVTASVNRAIKIHSITQHRLIISVLHGSPYFR